MEENGLPIIITIFAHKERLADRYSETFVGPLQFKGQRLTLICFTQILSRWNPAREIGASLPALFTKQFNQSTHQSVLTRFEDALKNINSVINTANQKIDSPVSVAIAIHTDREVYFSTAGDSSILLQRAGKSSVVSAKPKGAEAQEFATVTSGELRAHDRLCYGNEEFLAVCKQLGEAEDSAKALRAIIGAGATVETGCVVDVATQQTSHTTTVYANDHQLSVKLPSVNTAVLTTATTKMLAWSSQTTKIVSKQLKQLWQNRPKRPTRPKQSPQPIEHLEEAETTVPAKQQARRPKISIIGMVGILILLVLAAGAGYAVRKAIVARSQKAPPTVAEVPAIISDLTTANLDTIPTVLAQDLTQERYNYLTTTQQQQLANLIAPAQITITTPSTPLFTLPTTVALLATTPKNDVVYALDQTGQLYSWDGKTLVTIAQTTTISTPVSITAMAKNRVLVSDAQGNIYLFDGSDKQPLKLPQPTGWTTGKHLVQSYNGNLYVLTVTDGVVHKIPGFGADITNDSTLLTLPPDPTDPIQNFLINGDIVTLTKKTGLVNHPKSGKATTLLNSAVVGANSTATFGSSSIAVSNGNVVSYFTAQGQYQSATAVIASTSISQVLSYGTKGTLVVVGSNVYLLAK